LAALADDEISFVSSAAARHRSIDARNVAGHWTSGVAISIPGMNVTGAETLGLDRRTHLREGRTRNTRRHEP
jgi:hypothetical protein